MKFVSALWEKTSPHRLILGILAAALLLRLWHLGSLPPGATGAEAAAGLAGLNLVHHGQLWSAGVTPLTLAYSWISAPFLAIGHSLFWLRAVAVLAGLASVWGVYLWLSEWRGRGQGLVGAVIIAAMAWPLALSREAGAASLVPAITAWWLWLASRPPTTQTKLGLAGLGGAALYVSPELWWLWAGAIVYWSYTRQLWKRSNTQAGAAWLVLAFPAIIWIALHPSSAGSYLAFTGAWRRFSQFILHTVSAGGDWQQTVGAQPLFNAFYAIMAILGLVISLLRWKASRTLLLTIVAGLLAGSFGSEGSFALAVVPFVGLITCGVVTMLEWWYATFPINAAARSSGRLAIGLIVALAAYQGYVQYFVAFVGSTETYDVYREDAWQMGAEAAAYPRALVITDQPARQIISYQAYPHAVWFVTVKQLGSAPKSSYYIIGYGQRAAVEAALAKLAPGGKLRPHTSAFDNRDLYYTYQPK